MRLASADQTIPPPSAAARAGADASARGLVGRSLAGGKFILGELIGAGGMGWVYRARQTDLDREVAVKVLLPEFARDAEAVDRFMREARTIAKLTHPNIVKIHACNVEDGVCYLVMELVLGPGGSPTTLGSRIQSLGKGGRMSVEEVLSYARDALDALGHVHESRIVHRDIKPTNFLIDSAGRLKLTDFGLATGARGMAGLTQAGSTMGTLAYMAPEQQADAAGVDQRADIYSMGCLIYDLFIGSQSPNRLTSVSEVRPEVPPELDHVIRKAVSHAPEHRYASAREMLDAILRAVEPGSPVVAPGGGSSRAASSDKPSAKPTSQPGSQPGSKPNTARPSTPDPDATLLVRPSTQEARLDVPTLPDAQPPSRAPAPQTPAPAKSKARRPKRDSIVILGRSNAGKTLYITALYVRFKAVRKDLDRDVQIIPFDQATEDYCRNKIESLNRGEWPAANADSQILEFSVNHPEGHTRLVTMDPKGEAFEKAFNEMHQHDADVVKLLEHIDRAAALILVSDPQAVAKGGSNDDWLFWKSVCRLCGENAEEPVDIPVALVLTKHDVNAERISSAGGIDAFCARRYPRLVSRVPHLGRFTVSVCGQATRNGRLVPVPQLSRGVSDPFLFALEGVKPTPVDRVLIWMVVIIVLAIIASGAAYWHFMRDVPPPKAQPAPAVESGS